MTRALLPIVLVALFAVPAFGAGGLTPDYFSGAFGLDMIRNDLGLDTQIEPVSAQYAYDFAIDHNKRLLATQRILAAPGTADDPTGFVNEFSLLFMYDIVRGMNVFLGPTVSVMGDGFTGSPETLGGGTAGLSFPIEFGETWFVASYRYMRGDFGLRQHGVTFGPAFAIGSTASPETK